MGEIKLLEPRQDVELVFSAEQRGKNFQRVIQAPRAGLLPASARQARLQGHEAYQGDAWAWLDTWRPGDPTPGDAVTHESVTKPQAVTHAEGMSNAERQREWRKNNKAKHAEKQRAYRERRK